MRTAILAVAMCAAMANAEAVKRVDLGEAGALEAIQAQDPGRYEKIVNILEVAGDVSCETLPAMLKVQYGAGKVQCSGALILTSYPAKRHLRFELEDTEYVTNVVLRDAGGKLQPAQ